MKKQLEWFQGRMEFGYHAALELIVSVLLGGSKISQGSDAKEFKFKS